MTSDSKKKCEGSPADLPKSGNFAAEPLRAKIGTNLQALYEDVINEPIPDDFLSLLEDAEKSSKK